MGKVHEKQKFYILPGIYFEYLPFFSGAGHGTNNFIDSRLLILAFSVGLFAQVHNL